MVTEKDIQKAKDAMFPIGENGRSYEQSLAASGFELGARWASAFNEPNISFKEQMIRSCIEIALTDVSEKRFSDYGTSLKECLEWIEEQQNKIAFYEKQCEQKPFDYEHATITQKDFACDAEEASYTAEVETGDGSIKTVVSKKVPLPNPQSKEWSDEDESIVESIEEALEGYESMVSEDWEKEKEWLKSLKNRLSWKPSEEQMNALLGIMVELGFNYIDYNTLESLYNDLKKL